MKPGAALFIAEYAKRSIFTVDFLAKRFVVLECDCGDDMCEGFQMVSRRTFEWEQRLAFSSAEIIYGDGGKRHVCTAGKPTAQALKGKPTIQVLKRVPGGSA